MILVEDSQRTLTFTDRYMYPQMLLHTDAFANNKLRADALLSV